MRDLTGRIPDNIIDCHTHAALPEHLGVVPGRAVNHMMSTFPWNSLAMSDEITRLLYPGAAVQKVRFSSTVPGIDFKSVNKWLYGEIDRSRDAFALFGLQDDIEYTTEMLALLRPAALKMYYFTTDPPGTKISAVFPDEVIDVATQLDIPIILHLPVNIVDGLADLVSFCDDHPHQRIVLAHLGSPLFLRPGLEDAYQEIKRYDNVWLDTSCMEYSAVVSLALSVFGPSRLMFGSDEPLNLLRTAPFVHPQRGPRVVARRPYHWSDPDEHACYGHLASSAMHNHWQQISAILDAVAGLSSADDYIQMMFHDNARHFFSLP